MKYFFSVCIQEIKEWIYFILRNFPGRTGIILRSKFFFPKNIYNDVSISTGFHFDSFKTVSFGKNITIGAHCHFYSKGGIIEIQDNVAFNINVVLNSSIGGIILIEKNSLIGPNVIMRTANHNFDSDKIPINKQGHKYGDIIIKEDVWIGANSVILGNVKIGRGAIIGAGSVVNRNVESFSIVGGVPIKLLKHRKKNG